MAFAFGVGVLSMKNSFKQYISFKPNQVSRQTHLAPDASGPVKPQTFIAAIPPPYFRASFFKNFMGFLSIR